MKELAVSKINELAQENQKLKTRISDLEELCLLCSTKMNANIGLLQEEIIKSVNLKSDDSILLAIAGLKQVRDQLNPAFRLDNDASNSTSDAKDKREVKYGKYQQHQLVQTSFDGSQPIDDESTSTLIRRRLSSLLKSTESPDDKDDKAGVGEIKARLRSLSLKSGNLLTDAASNFMTALSGSGEQTSYLKRIENDPANASPAIDGLDDEEQTSVNMKLGNAKLVLNASACKDANSNEIVDNNFVLIERN